MGTITKRLAAFGAAIAAATTLAVIPTEAQGEPPRPEPAAPALLDVGGAASTAGDQVDAARAVDVDTSLLKPGVARTVSIDVLSADLQVALDPMPSEADGWAAWNGAVAGEPASSATVVRKGDDVAGLVTTAEGTYRIRTTAPGQQVVQVIDGSAFPDSPEDGVTPPATFDLGVSPDQVAEASPAPTADGDVPLYPVVDVLVGYTPAALTLAGSQNAMNSEIALAISVSNTAYADSGIAGRLRLAGTTALTENLTLSSQSLNWLTGKSDGHSDQIHALRNSTGADLVSVLTDDGTSCGLAWVLNSLASASAQSPYGFSVVDYPCAVDNLSFPHELGHNMGAQHDRYVESNPILFPYAVGYVNVAKEWRTIMAYNNQCAAQSVSGYCTRIARFSNPDATYLGDPTGRPASGSSPADNRQVHNKTQGFVSTWRSKPAPFTSWAKFVTQQFKDFQGRTPTSGESSSAVTSLNEGAQTPQAYIDGQLKGAFGASYAPVARLYFAYFVRSPDPGGLDYWVRRYKGGMRLTAISSNFAASSEFKTKYGSLSNRAFVEKIYENLFQRTGDPTGVNYWTGKLDRREKTRGEVMINFSESSEFKRVRAEEIDVVLLYRAMLQRAATPTEFNSQVGRLQGGTTIQRLILEVLDTTEYANRVVK